MLDEPLKLDDSLMDHLVILLDAAAGRRKPKPGSARAIISPVGSRPSTVVDNGLIASR